MRVYNTIHMCLIKKMSKYRHLNAGDSTNLARAERLDGVRQALPRNYRSASNLAIESCRSDMSIAIFFIWSFARSSPITELK